MKVSQKFKYDLPQASELDVSGQTQIEWQALGQQEDPSNLITANWDTVRCITAH